MIFTCCSLSALASGVSGALSSSFLSSPPGIDGIDWERKKRGDRSTKMFSLDSIFGFKITQGEAWTVNPSRHWRHRLKVAFSQFHIQLIWTRKIGTDSHICFQHLRLWIFKEGINVQTSPRPIFQSNESSWVVFNVYPTATSVIIDLVLKQFLVLLYWLLTGSIIFSIIILRPDLFSGCRSKKIRDLPQNLKINHSWFCSSSFSPENFTPRYAHGFLAKISLQSIT